MLSWIGRADLNFVKINSEAFRIHEDHQNLLKCIRRFFWGLCLHSFWVFKFYSDSANILIRTELSILPDVKAFNKSKQPVWHTTQKGLPIPRNLSELCKYQSDTTKTLKTTSSFRRIFDRRNHKLLTVLKHRQRWPNSRMLLWTVVVCRSNHPDMYTGTRAYFCNLPEQLELLLEIMMYMVVGQLLESFLQVPLDFLQQLNRTCLSNNKWSELVLSTKSS